MNSKRKPLFPEVRVNGRVIPAEDIATEAQNHEAPAGKPGIAWRKAARALVIRRLLLDEAERRGLHAQPQELAPGLRETDEDALMRAAIEAGISPEPVDRSQLRAQYDAAPERFRSPPLYDVAHILYAADPDDDEARRSASARAENALARLADAPDSFETIAREESDCPSREQGGRLGQIGPGDTVPEFEQALELLGAGETGPRPVVSRFGYHVIRMIARADSAQLPFEAVEKPLAEALEKDAWARAAQEFTARLVEQADISGIDMTPPQGGA